MPTLAAYFFFFFSKFISKYKKDVIADSKLAKFNSIIFQLDEMAGKMEIMTIIAKANPKYQTIVAS